MWTYTHNIPTTTGPGLTFPLHGQSHYPPLPLAPSPTPLKAGLLSFSKWLGQDHEDNGFRLSRQQADKTGQVDGSMPACSVAVYLFFFTCLLYSSLLTLPSLYSFFCPNYHGGWVVWYAM